MNIGTLDRGQEETKTCTPCITCITCITCNICKKLIKAQPLYLKTTIPVMRIHSFQERQSNLCFLMSLMPKSEGKKIWSHENFLQYTHMKPPSFSLLFFLFSVTYYHETDIMARNKVTITCCYRSRQRGCGGIIVALVQPLGNNSHWFCGKCECHRKVCTTAVSRLSTECKLQLAVWPLRAPDWPMCQLLLVVAGWVCHAL